MIEIMNAAAVRHEWVGSLAGGRFPLLRWLGGSQDAGVFLTELSEQGQKAIIKLVPANAEDAEARVASWEAATSLSHPNLMQVYSHGRCEIDGVACLYVVTEFADEVLAEILSERPLTTQETRELLSPALDALSYLHAKGLVHSRLKPSNIMAAGDRLKLSTDGLSSAGAAARPSSTRTVYDAPETELGSIGPAADIWSLGATLVDALTKYPPVWNRAKAAEPTVPESMPEPFASIARKCLRSDPARRTTIEAIMTRLEPARAQSRPEEKAKGPSPARRRIAVLLAIVAVVLAGIGIWNALSHRVQPPSAAPEAQSAPVPAPAQPPVATPAPAVASNETASTAPPPSPAATSATPPASNTAPAPVPAPAPPPQATAQTQASETPAPAGATVNGAVAQQVLPNVLPSAMKTITGTLKVSVRLAVAADGSVTNATLESAGPSKYFAGKALEASRHWKFKPAQAGGATAPSSWILNFQFKRTGITVVPEKAAQ